MPPSLENREGTKVLIKIQKSIFQMLYFGFSFIFFAPRLILGGVLEERGGQLFKIIFYFL